MVSMQSYWSIGSRKVKMMWVGKSWDIDYLQDDILIDWWVLLIKVDEYARGSVQSKGYLVTLDNSRLHVDVSRKYIAQSLYPDVWHPGDEAILSKTCTTDTKTAILAHLYA